jgi:hypothetical protein
MIQTKALAEELARARLARGAAEDACCDVEGTLWEAQRGPRYWRRIALSEWPEEPKPQPH